MEITQLGNEKLLHAFGHKYIDRNRRSIKGYKKMAIQLPFQNYTHVIINHLCLVSVKLSSIHEQTDFEFYNPTLEELFFSPCFPYLYLYSSRIASRKKKSARETTRRRCMLQFRSNVSCFCLVCIYAEQSREGREGEREIFGIIFLRFSIVAVLPGRVKGGKGRN